MTPQDTTICRTDDGGRPKFIYQDCRCLFDELSCPIPTWSLITSEELKQAHLTEDGFTNLCMKNISNAFENVPFDDEMYGLLGSVPHKMLHVSGTSLPKHMFGCLDRLIEDTYSKKDKESFHDLHHSLVKDAEQQSERDFPCMSICNGIIDGTKMCGSKRVGNCFVLFCVMHTHLGQKLMGKEMNKGKISMKRFKNCLKLYLFLERWVIEPHPQSQVCRSPKVLGNLINMINDYFPRDKDWE